MDTKLLWIVTIPGNSCVCVKYGMFMGHINSGFGASLHLIVKMIPILEPYKVFRWIM